MVYYKRVYEKPDGKDGYRILVDRLWPRGLSKEKAHIDLWLKEIAPSSGLRQWFHHEDSNWEGFEEKYSQELDHKIDFLQKILSLEKEHGAVTLLYGAKDTEHNQAVILAKRLQNTL